MRKIPSLMILAPVVFVGCYSGSRPPHLGTTAKDFTVKDSDRTAALSQFRGQVVVLNFWATSCSPCVAELPSIMDMQERLRSRSVTVLGVSIDVDDDAYDRFLDSET